MTQRTLGITLIVGGGLIIIVGLIGLLSGSGESEDTAAPTSTEAEVASTTSEVAPTTSSTALPTTTTSTMTSSTTTTTLLDATAEIEAFVPQFADAIARQDVDFLFARLHPAVKALFGEDLCRTFIEAEILLLEDYRLTGPVTGPTEVVLGDMTVDAYEGPVSFGFQGENFDATATFAFEDGVRWFTECR